MEAFHAVIDFVLPALTGTLLGIAAHYLHLRAKMADLEKQRAESLIGDLHKIERDQAVWVVSASLLHELKNPVHAMGLLLDEVIELADSEREHQRELLLRARARVERIAQELGTLRALPVSARRDLPTIDVTAATSDATSAIRQKAPWISVTCSPLPPRPMLAKADPAYLRIILGNILENAADALAGADVSEDAKIELRVAEDGEHCALEVSDNGVGIDTEMRDHLFEPLATTKPGGMGLGLAIARTLARSMGGDLRVVDQARGVGFRLTLPSAGSPL